MARASKKKKRERQRGEKSRREGRLSKNFLILEVVEDINDAALGLKPTQVKFVTLRVPYYPFPDNLIALMMTK